MDAVNTGFKNDKAGNREKIRNKKCKNNKEIHKLKRKEHRNIRIRK